MKKFIKHTTCLYFEEHYVWFEKYEMLDEYVSGPDPDAKSLPWDDNLYDELLDEATADDFCLIKNKAGDDMYLWFVDEKGNRVKKFDPRWTWKKIGMFDCMPV